MPIGWQPYTYGHWVWTVDGWLWLSDWSWGWAPFHYGRWSYDAIYGWVWVPGHVWAPAWVAWRTGGGWVGWAPLPPGASWRIGIGLELGRVDLRMGIAHHHWLFVQERSFLERRLRQRLLHPARNATVFDKTGDVTRYSERERRVINHGPDSDRMGEIAGKALVARSLRSSDGPLRSPTTGRDSRGDVIEVYRPKVGNGSTKGKPSVREDGSIRQPDKGTSERSREIDKWAEARRKELDRIHDTERKKAAAEDDRKRTLERQEAERKALERRVERQKQVKPPTVRKPPSSASPKKPSRPPSTKAPTQKAKPKKPPTKRGKPPSQAS